MKKFQLLLVTALMVVSAWSCNKDTTPAEQRPTIAISDITFDAKTMSVSAMITPSANSDCWYWKVERSGETAEFTKESGAAKSVSFEVEYDEEYKLTAYAENEAGTSEQLTEQLKYEKTLREEPLATIELLNVTAFTLDAAITKHDDCVRYVAGAMHTDAYDEATFIEQAQSSLTPDESYPLVIYNSATESAVFTEQTLAKNALATSDDNSGVMLLAGKTYTVAVYAEDADGYYEVYTVEQLIPEAEINGVVGVTIEMTNVTETSAEMSVTATEECKLLAGYLEYVSLDPDNPFDFEGKSDTEIKEAIVTLVHDIPMSYTEAVTIPLSDILKLDTKYMAYAIAIKDGKIGEVAYHTFTTSTAELSGSATITAATIAEQTTHEQLSVTLSTDGNASKVRLYAAPENDHAAYADNMEYIMGADEYQNYREEYAVTNNTAVAIVDIYHPGDNYYLYAVAVDSEGKAGEMVCVAQLAGLGTEYYTTIEEQIAAGDFTLDGTGEVKMTATITEKSADNINADISVSATSDNVAKIWLVRSGNNALVDDIETIVTKSFADDPTKPKGAVQLAEDGVTYSYEYMLPYDKTWGGTIVIAVVLDTDGKYNISKYYLAGMGVRNY